MDLIPIGMRALLRHTKKIIRFFFLIAGILMALLLAFHFWFIYHSEKTIEDFITWASDGKLKSTIKKCKIDYINNNIDIRELTIFNTDSLIQSTSYRFSAKNFHLRIRSRWELIFYKKLLIDSVIFNSPDIVVTRRGLSQKDTTNKKLLLAEELGNVYKTITGSLTALNLQRFEITEGNVLIRENGEEKRPPFRLNHIFLSVDKFNIDSTSARDSSHFIFSDRIRLRIPRQRILLPDARSSVSFDELLIDSKEKLIRISHPEVRILPQPGQQNSFTSSAKSLAITGLDFNGLYQKQLVRADSVLLLNPAGQLELYTGEKTNSVKNKKRTPIDSALLQLPLAIEIRHLALLHGDGLMHLRQPGKTTTFQTKNDNINIEGLRINDSAGNPFVIAGFNYILRNYTGYTPDSIYRLHFDSLQFTDNKILLYDFKAVTLKKSRATLIRDYAAPRFEITGMDWFSFIFDNHFIARSAILYDAVLHIEKNDSLGRVGGTGNGKKRSIYKTLSVMDSILDLEQLRIVNGNFSYRMGSGASLNLFHLNLDINADELTQAGSVNQILASVKELSFDTASIANQTALLLIRKSVFSRKDKRLALDEVYLDIDKSYLKAAFNGVKINDFSFDNRGLDINDFRWDRGTIHIGEQSGRTEKINLGGNGTSFLLRNILGGQTTVYLENKEIKGKLALKTLSASQIFRESGNPLEIQDLLATGDSLQLVLPDTRIRCGGFRIEDGRSSHLENLLFEKYSKTDTALIRLPALGLIPNIHKSVENRMLIADSVELTKPEFFLSLRNEKSGKRDETAPVELPLLRVSRVAIKNASLRMGFGERKTGRALECKDLSLFIDSVQTPDRHALSFGKLGIHSPGPLYLTGDRLAVKTGPNTMIDLKFLLVDPARGAWQAALDRWVADSLEYTQGQPDQKIARLSLADLAITHLSAEKGDLKSPLSWLINRSGGKFRFESLKWKTDNLDLGIRDIQYSQPAGQLFVGSFRVDPGKTRDDFLSEIVYRKDYLEGKTGQIKAEGMEMHGDSLFISRLSVNRGMLSVYSDKFKKPGVPRFEPLPVAILKKLPGPFRINRIDLENMEVAYTERNEETRQTGSVFFDRINAAAFDIGSVSGHEHDSLAINLSARFLSSFGLQLSMAESYSDPLGGLRLRLQLGPGDLRLLNPFLAPLASIRAASGYLDTLSLTATGNEWLSQGSMQMYYHGLRAEILDSGKLQKRRFGTRLLGFAASAFFIRKENHKRQGNFKFYRQRKKSVITDLLSMVVQGASASIAPFSKLLYKKQYKKDIKNMDNPEQP